MAFFTAEKMPKRKLNRKKAQRLIVLESKCVISISYTTTVYIITITLNYQYLIEQAFTRVTSSRGEFLPGAIFVPLYHLLLAVYMTTPCSDFITSIHI